MKFARLIRLPRARLRPQLDDSTGHRQPTSRRTPSSSPNPGSHIRNRFIAGVVPCRCSTACRPAPHRSGRLCRSWFARLKLHSVSRASFGLPFRRPFWKSWINNQLPRSDHQPISRPEDCGNPEGRNSGAHRNATPVSKPAERRASPETVLAAAHLAAPASRSQPGRSFSRSRLPRLRRASGPRSRPAAVWLAAGLRFTFDTFVEGSSNRVALAAAKTIAEAGQGAVRFNPLFVHSSVGLGKTHLLQAIANAAVQNPRWPARRLSDGRIFHVAFRNRDPRQ